MKVTGLRVHLASEWRPFLFIEVETDAGITGVGEAGLTSRERAVEGALSHLAPLVIGQSPFDTERLWQEMFRSGFFPAGTVQTAAIAAIDIALWDIKAQALRVPLYQLLGGAARDRVLTYAHVHGEGRAELLDHASRLVDDGWRHLRFEPHHEKDGIFDPMLSVDHTLENWAALRDRTGPAIGIALDCHTRFDMPTALRLCRGAEAFAPLFIEDPFRSEMAEQYALLRQQTIVPLAAGEQFGSKWQFKPLIDAHSIDIARIDLTIAGGITEGLKIAAMCEATGIDIALHNPIGPVATAAALHFSLAISNMAVMELPRRPGETMPDALPSTLAWVDGYLLKPEEPGLGVRLEREAMSNHPFIDQPMPRLKRHDGSFQNW